MRFDITQGDVNPPLGLELTGITDLGNATQVNFVMHQADGTQRIEGEMVIDDIPTARVHYQWQSTDTAIPGIYRAQAVVLFPGSQPETFPSEETLYVIVHPKL